MKTKALVLVLAKDANHANIKNVSVRNVKNHATDVIKNANVIINHVNATIAN
jgi:hypothetical protein